MGMNFKSQAPVVQRADNFIQWISRHPVEQMYHPSNVLASFSHHPILKYLLDVRFCARCCVATYPLD